VHWRWRLVLGLALCCAPNAEALAEKRVALVIGNSAYQHAPRLPNPSNDATAVAKLIKDIGFDLVDFRRDLVGIDLRRAIREFAQQARGADIAIVFYAGHGIEVNGTNYLVPTDGKLEQDFDVEDEAVPLDRLLGAIEPAKRLRLVILDACRDNPFVKKMKRTIATRAVGQGLAKVELRTSDTLIAFAAKAGSLANDGEGSHSPFTAALLKHLPSPGVDVRLMFGRVRDEVLASTNRKQEPFVYGSLGGADVALVPAPAAPPANMAGDARYDYELAERVGTVEAWDIFLARYGTGFYAKLAREQRGKLLQAKAETKNGSEEQERRTKAAEAERQRLEREKVERERAGGEQLAGIERERTEREKAERERVRREEAVRAEEERRAREQEEREKSAAAEPAKAQVALVPPSAGAVPRAPPPPSTRGELALAIKKELKRVGCYSGKVDDSWGHQTLTTSMKRFVKYAKFSGASDEPSNDLLDAVRGSEPGLCPLECGPRETERNGHCVAKTCPPGHRLGRGGACIELESRAPARHKSTAKRRDEKPASKPRSTRAEGAHESPWKKCSHSIGRYRSSEARGFSTVEACARGGGH
jgi:uncharacterized caspase-like protein